MGKINDNIKSGEECCKLANQRFGLSFAIGMLLERLNCCDNTKAALIDMAKQRNLMEFQSLLAQVSNIGDGGACFVTIIKDVK